MRIAVPDFVSSTFIRLIAAKEPGIVGEEGQDCVQDRRCGRRTAGNAQPRFRQWENSP